MSTASHKAVQTMPSLFAVVLYFRLAEPHIHAREACTFCRAEGQLVRPCGLNEVHASSNQRAREQQLYINIQLYINTNLQIFIYTCMNRSRINFHYGQGFCSTLSHLGQVASSQQLVAGSPMAQPLHGIYVCTILWYTILYYIMLYYILLYYPTLLDLIIYYPIL